MSNYYYKYQSINLDEEFSSSQTIANLFDCIVTFSSRKAFNDLFDSKVKLIPPSKDDYKKIWLPAPKKIKYELKSAINCDFYGFFERLKTDVESIFDSYKFYCISSNPSSNLMWSHYANSHKGFCIEWKSEYLKAAEVFYEEKIPIFHLLDTIKVKLGLLNENDMGNRIWNALRTKLSEWGYECEHRLLLSSELRSEYNISHEDELRAFIKFNPEAIESVIFGVRCPQKVREHIMSHNPNNIKYKQIVIQDHLLVPELI